MDVGDTLAGRYRVLRQLGAGGMGQVFLAADDELGREVAVKVLPPDAVEDGTARARLIREARAAAQLSIRGVVAIHDVGETPDGGVFVVMERVDGMSLREAIEAEASHDPIDVLVQLARILDRAHDKGVVHRDIKPDNVMIDAAGDLTVLDFGLAKHLALDEDAGDAMTLTASGGFVGTPAYLSPEQARGGSDPDVDRWGLSVLAFELLTGRLPWRSDSFTALLLEIVGDEPPRESGLGAPVDRVFARAFDRDLEARFATATDFVDALERAIEGDLDTEGEGAAEPLPAAAPSKAERSDATRDEGASPAPTPRPERPPTGAIMSGRRLALAVGAVVVAGAVAWLVMRPDEAPAEPAPTAPVAAGPEVVIACPLHDVVDAPFEETGWLGAASADALCRSVATARGRRMENVRPPARLLEVPETPVEGWSLPYDEPDAPERSRAAAEGADVVLEGTLRAPEAGRFTLQVRWGGRRIEAEGDALYSVASDLVGQMVERGWLETQPPSALARLRTGATTYEELAAFEVAYSGLDGGAAVESGCRWLSDRAELWPNLHERATATCPAYGVEIGAASTVPRDPLARRLERIASGPWGSDGAADLAAGLAAARREHGDPEVAAYLAAFESQLRTGLGETADAQALGRRAVRGLPHDCEARAVASLASIGTTSRRLLAELAVAWCPSAAEGWRFMTYEHQADALGLENDRRSYFLSPESAFSAALLGRALLDAGRSEALLELAARYPADGLPYETLAAAFLRALVDGEERRFTDAFERAMSALEADPTELGVSHGNNRPLFMMVMHMAAMRSDEARRDAAQRIASHYILPESGRELGWDGSRGAIFVCMHIGAERAPACFDVVASQLERLFPFPGIDDYLRGARAWAAGDRDAARLAWRGVTAAPFTFPPEAWDPGDDPVRAAQIESRLEAVTAPVRGARMVDVVRARQAHARGDREEAVRRAQKVIDAWAPLDEPLAVVEEMRIIVGSLGP